MPRWFVYTWLLLWAIWGVSAMAALVYICARLL